MRVGDAHVAAGGERPEPGDTQAREPISPIGPREGSA